MWCSLQGEGCLVIVGLQTGWAEELELATISADFGSWSAAVAVPGICLGHGEVQSPFLFDQLAGAMLLPLLFTQFSPQLRHELSRQRRSCKMRLTDV